MKTNIIFVLLLGFVNNILISQEVENQNYIHGKIKVPIIIDQIMTEDYFLDDRRDSNKKIENVTFDIYTQLKKIPIYFWGKGSFKGTSIEEINNLVTIITISGHIDFKTNLGKVKVQQTETKNTKSGICDYKYEYSYNYEYKDLNVNTILPIGTKEKNKNISYFFKPNKNSKLTIKNYKYIEDTKCPKRNYSKEFIYKNINEEYLKEKLTGFGSYFSFNANWNGKTIDETVKESIIIKIVRDEDPNWEPPSTQYLNEDTKIESNSIAVYYDIKGVENSKVISQGMANLLISDLAKIPSLKILERGKINNILQEITLNKSGLVKEATKVENKLMKEEMAVIINVDNTHNKAECKIVSKNKEVLITYSYSNPMYIFEFEKSLLEVLFKEINQQFKLSVDSNIIYR